MRSTATLIVEIQRGSCAILKLEEIQQGKTIAGVVPGKLVRVVAAEMRGDGALELVYSVEGSLGQRRLSRADEDGLLLTSNQTWWRRADPKVLAMLVLLIGALGVYKFLTWSTPDTDGPVSNDMPVFIRTNGGMLEVGQRKTPIKYARGGVVRDPGKGTAGIKNFSNDFIGKRVKNEPKMPFPKGGGFQGKHTGLTSGSDRKGGDKFTTITQKPAKGFKAQA